MSAAENTAAQALTHHVQLVLDNDQGLYNYRRELVQQAIADEYPRMTLADSLKDWCEDLAGLESDDMGMFPRELLSTALAFVDWHGMAVAYIAEEQES